MTDVSLNFSSMSLALYVDRSSEIVPDPGIADPLAVTLTFAAAALAAWKISQMLCPASSMKAKPCASACFRRLCLNASQPLAVPSNVRPGFFFVPSKVPMVRQRQNDAVG